MGRDPSATINLEDERASRRHAVIRFEGGDWLYEDLASTNGSFVDGARVGRLLIDRERVIRIGNPATGEVIRLVPGPVPAAAASIARSVVLGGLIVGIASLAALGVLISGNLAVTQSPSPSALAASPSPSPSAIALTIRDVAAIGRASTVQIVQGSVLGSGVYLGNGQILTAAHVVPTTAQIVISFDERRVGVAGLLRVDGNDDLALLSADGLDAAGARPIVWGDSTGLRQGDALVALGFPAGLPLSVSAGVVSGLREDGGTSLIQTDTLINPGMSGGPVLDSRGRLIGISDFIFPRYPGLSFAIASSTARDFVDGHR